MLGELPWLSLLLALFGSYGLFRNKCHWMVSGLRGNAAAILAGARRLPG